MDQAKAQQREVPTPKGRPRKHEPGSKQWTSVYTDRELWQKLKALAYWERRTIAGIHEQVLREFLTKWEKTNGTIDPIPPDADL